MSDLNWSLISDSCHRKLPTLISVFEQLFKIALLKSRGALPGTRVSTEWSLQAQNKPEGPKTQDKPYHVYSYNLTPLDVRNQAGRKRGDPQPFPLQHGDALGTDVLTPPPPCCWRPDQTSPLLWGCRRLTHSIKKLLPQLCRSAQLPWRFCTMELLLL